MLWCIQGASKNLGIHESFHLLGERKLNCKGHKNKGNWCLHNQYVWRKHMASSVARSFLWTLSLCSLRLLFFFCLNWFLSQLQYSYNKWCFLFSLSRPGGYKARFFSHFKHESWESRWLSCTSDAYSYPSDSSQRIICCCWCNLLLLCYLSQFPSKHIVLLGRRRRYGCRVDNQPVFAWRVTWRCEKTIMEQFIEGYLAIW